MPRLFRPKAPGASRARLSQLASAMTQPPRRDDRVVAQPADELSSSSTPLVEVHWNSRSLTPAQEHSLIRCEMDQPFAAKIEGEARAIAEFQGYLQKTEQEGEGELLEAGRRVVATAENPLKGAALSYQCAGCFLPLFYHWQRLGTKKEYGWPLFHHEDQFHWTAKTEAQSLWASKRVELGLPAKKNNSKSSTNHHGGDLAASDKLLRLPVPRAPVYVEAGTHVGLGVNLHSTDWKRQQHQQQQSQQSLDDHDDIPSVLPPQQREGAEEGRYFPDATGVEDLTAGRRGKSFELAYRTITPQMPEKDLRRNARRKGSFDPGVWKQLIKEERDLRHQRREVQPLDRCHCSYCQGYIGMLLKPTLGDREGKRYLAANPSSLSCKFVQL